MPASARLATAVLGMVAFAGVAALNGQETSPPSGTDERIEFYRQRLGGPGTYPAYARLGAAYIQKARETGNLAYYGEAERHLRRSLEFQRNFEALHWLGVALLHQHRFREALPYAQEAVETLPASVEAQAALFDLHVALGDDERAETVLHTLRSLQLGFTASARAASLQQIRGDSAGALKHMQQACSEAATSPAEMQAWCLVRLGSLQLAVCDAESAEAAYLNALEVFPGYSFALEHLAELRAAQGRTAEAGSLYQKLLETNPEPLLRLALADLLESAGQPAEAEPERTKALQQMQESVGRREKVYLRPLALWLSSSSKSAGDGLRLAKEDWENRQDALAADTLAWAYFVNGRKQEARDLYNKVLRTGGREPLVLLHAAEVYLATDDRERARDALNPLQVCPSSLLPVDRARMEKLRTALESPHTQ